MATEDGFVVLPHAKVVFQPSRDHSGQWRATITGRDQPSGWFGPAFATEAEARALCRAAAVALAEGTGGVFGEPAAVHPLKTGDRVRWCGGPLGVVGPAVCDVGFDVTWDSGAHAEYDWGDFGNRVKLAEPAAVPAEWKPVVEVKPELPLKVGDRVKYIDEGPRYGDRGVVTGLAKVGFGVKWGDEDDECEYEWADVGLYVIKADEPAEVKPEAPSGPKVGMRVKIIDPNDADFGDEGVVRKVYDDGGFSVAWDDDKWTPCVAADFGKWVGPA